MPLSHATAPHPPSPDRPERMRYLVTGGRGFIGRHLIRRLLAMGADVHATTRAGRSLEPGPRWWMCDLSDLAATQQVVREVRPDVVVHLASRAAGTRALDVVVPMLADNLLSAVHVMTASAAVPGCRAVLAGSIEEIAAAGDGARSPYAASKVAATAYAELFRDLWDLPVTVLRLAMVYGPDEPNRKRLVPYVIDSLLRGVAPELSSGRRRVDWVYVDDVVDALLAASTEAGAAGKVLDVGSGAVHSIRDTVALIADTIGASVPPGFGRLPDRAKERDLVADIGPAVEHLRWQPKVDLPTGIARTVDWHLAEMSGPALREAAQRRTA
ncbi:dTDP-glucose 4,6-dehydratase [Pseudonocardia hierapolitana]|uniref:dTDP-glucose 4,6-dehydratase n=1 Tax=Pseudonocardia hierapolitana TaxID=1128676 RepID=A0A561SJ01_9PSEU|nr:NAD(P)-dependent oxidoreductase [Pseudonocardia hierapolitana]TWF74856.1 dTDP-glucose 4,6-dehydratase [Pseudonocardia hierapolitana]